MSCTDSDPLQALIPHLQVGTLSSEQLEITVQYLDKLAVALRDEQARTAHFDLPQHLVTLLNGGSGANQSQLHSVWLQVGRVAANFVADNDENRTRMEQSGYIDSVLVILQDSSLPVQVTKPLLASLLNLVVDAHDSSIQRLARTENWSRLLTFANAIGTRQEEEEDIQSVRVWTWRVISLVAKDARFERLEDEQLVIMNLPVREVIECHSNDVFVQWLEVAEHAVASLEYVSTAGTVPPFILGPSSRYLFNILHFIEYTRLPSAPSSTSLESEDDDEDAGKRLGRVKAAAIRAVIELASHTTIDDPHLRAFWAVMERWLSLGEREDLISCALLVFGNGVRGDDSAIQFSSSQIFVTVLSLLSRTSQMTIRHALFGLLRNLSIPKQNKVVLGGHVLERLADMNPWDSEGDIAPSVQAGAIGVVKHLCRDNAVNARQFLLLDMMTPLLDLYDRTDDQTVKFETARVFVNTARSLSKGDGVSDLNRLEDKRVLAVLLGMLREGQKHPLLINEALIGLSLIVTFGKTDPAGLQLLDGSLHLFCDILLEDAQSVEIKSNTATLIKAFIGRRPDSRTTVIKLLHGGAGVAEDLRRELS